MEKIVNKVMDKLLQAQAENDKKFYDLEKSGYDLNKVRKNEERRKRISIEVVWVDGSF